MPRQDLRVLTPINGCKFIVSFIFTKRHKRAENWVSIRWIAGKYDGIIYDINRRNMNAKLPFKLGQIV